YSDATTCNSYGTAQEDGSCVCESNHYGSVCTTFCEASTTCNGNGVCDLTGSCSCSSALVISQFYAAGGNSGAVYNQKYVELHNRGTTPIVLDETWALQYAAAGATQEFYSGISLVRLEGTLEAGGYFLVYLRTQQSNGVPLGVDADQQTQVFEPSMTGGKLALVKTGSLLTGSACPTLSNPDVADFLLYGNAACPGGGEDKVASPSRVEAMARKDAGCMNTGSNGADFELVNLSNGANLPRNTQSPVASPCDCEW
ncbi:MAG: lamin tail domain-containing protein, partial [Cystobacterineae bacterium]|nr:lamin tail domain-containing protein [Cystobacterineae bacterium]